MLPLAEEKQIGKKKIAQAKHNRVPSLGSCTPVRSILSGWEQHCAHHAYLGGVRAVSTQGVRTEAKDHTAGLGLVSSSRIRTARTEAAAAAAAAAALARYNIYLAVDCGSRGHCPGLLPGGRRTAPETYCCSLFCK